jgi:hypothetical protein
MGISLSKIEREAPELLSLAKIADEAISLHRLRGQKSKVALALDFSLSMSNEYKKGTVQRLAEKVLALATQLDDDGAIDLFLFDTQADYLGEVTLANFRDIIAQFTKGRRMGSTNYADLFRKLVAHYNLTPQTETVVTGTETVTIKGGFLKKDSEETREIVETRFIPLKSPINEPILAIFLTDGAPNSRPEAVAELTKASYSPIFWQFLSIGDESIPFLQKLDDLPKRFIDNADYKPVGGDIDKVTDAKLFSMILDEYPAWVIEQRKRGQIR